MKLATVLCTRPETIEAGSNMLAGIEPGGVLAALDVALDLGTDWEPPPCYLDTDVTETVVKIVLVKAFRVGSSCRDGRWASSSQSEVVLPTLIRTV